LTPGETEGTRKAVTRFIDHWWALPVAASTTAPREIEEAAMPYLFWATVPFELMRMWWEACERQRETAAR
jgi:hypothetical protein